MLRQKTYRLHDYKIIEQGETTVQWEKYSDFGVQQSGPCFVNGDILIIGRPSNEEIGLLIGEFQEQLEKSPPWTRTKYYCREDAITGWSTQKPRDHRKSPSLNHPCPGKFRLGPHLIEVQANNMIGWRAYLGNGRVGRGRGEMGGGVLFLTEQTFEDNQDRKQFQRELKSLPVWSFTESYAPFGVVASCADRFFREPVQQGAKSAHILSPEANATPPRTAALKSDRATRAGKPEAGVGTDDSRTAPPAPLKKHDALNHLQPRASTLGRQGAAFTRASLSGATASKTKTAPTQGRRRGWAWKAGLVGTLITTLVLGALVVFLFHHDIGSLTKINHSGGHSRGHHYKRHVMD
ncbi:MAG: hypothetical protein V1816_14605 [Pseudomonadota bacterium]